jgi:oxygen-dependent protoporphyrinogen oxidase
MTRIAILGGGISGLTAAYELEKSRLAGATIDWRLYESSNRLGGIIQTTHQDGFILEGGPDAWVTEKPWARTLAIELGLEAELIDSNDATRKTYIYLDNTLQPIPDNMRMMVPTDLAALDHSPLFSTEAKQAYAAELTRAEELRATSPTEDESVATFIQRHFGEEVLTTLAAPLLSGVFGGDVHKLSVRAVMPAFVAMEQQHGSLIAALQSKSRSTPTQPIFTSLRNGIESLTQALIAKLPADRLHLNRPALSLKRERNLWCLRTAKGSGKAKKHFNQILLATSTDTTRNLLTPIAPEAASLLPNEASSAILINLVWPAELAAIFTVPLGFGFLIPQNPANTSLLAATFVDQKLPHRAPPNARILRAFFGGPSAASLAHASDTQIITTALTQLRQILGPIPNPTITTVRHLPRSLPQYEVGHQTRIAQLDELLTRIANLTLLGNAYRGVGLPDLIRDAQSAVAKLTNSPNSPTR